MKPRNDETRSRVHAAVLTANALAGVGPAPPRCAMPVHLYEAEDLEEGDWRGTTRSLARDASLRFQPTPAQQDDMLRALSWLAPMDGLAKLERWEWSLLWRRAHQEWQLAQFGGRKVSWRSMATYMRTRHDVNRSYEWWRRHHNGLIDRADYGRRLVEKREGRVDSLTEFGHICPTLRSAARAA